jgi:hypothetical protein
MLGSAGRNALQPAHVSCVLRQASVMTSICLAGALGRMLRSAAASRGL